VYAGLTYVWEVWVGVPFEAVVAERGWHEVRGAKRGQCVYDLKEVVVQVLV